MKRWIALALSVITLLAAACVFSVSAEGNGAADWSVYAMEETKTGSPFSRILPRIRIPSGACV